MDIIEKRQRREIELDKIIENFELQLKGLSYRITKLERVVL